MSVLSLLMDAFLNRLVVILERKTYIHDLGQLNILDTIDTVPNPRGSFPDLFHSKASCKSRRIWSGALDFWVVLHSWSTTSAVCHHAGLCALSANQENCYLALPASTTTGSVLVFDALVLHALCQVQVSNLRDLRLLMYKYYPLVTCPCCGTSATRASPFCRRGVSVLIPEGTTTDKGGTQRRMYICGP